MSLFTLENIYFKSLFTVSCRLWPFPDVLSKMRDVPSQLRDVPFCSVICHSFAASRLSVAACLPKIAKTQNIRIAPNIQNITKSPNGWEPCFSGVLGALRASLHVVMGASKSLTFDACLRVQNRRSCVTTLPFPHHGSRRTIDLPLSQLGIKKGS
jgi:hypothetical protein